METFEKNKEATLRSVFPKTEGEWFVDAVVENVESQLEMELSRQNPYRFKPH